ncbi:TPA: LysR family transcriptional regulator [Pseudomonas aeruginosa]|uniref:LysR family transcriptional regulator n=1 Tax=Pseudomonadota TaxID=1224 RepID=UPI0005BCA9D9|nr:MULTISPECIES: LysR family transcriptional regulator [Pseudomonadota]MBP2693550.1 LysR family transcriptional regulator [Pseudomonas aeruginosa]MBX6713471.1 LysR family transcriptional regulator [Pseudomonas aeruginosa]MCS8376882.1 LysR family transcriptional regulator [Pseudomonas aeruginosa]MDH4695434.1 LysR family transcriptional regulator [Pseudomonas aeruginosa]MDY1528897.1 LysR family transcriptional regulator [Pseudomonas aeruginosa]
MLSDKNGELESPLTDTRLPSLLALRCFEAAARLENFSRAADELHLTHGAVSRAVGLLEDELGVALFERRSRRVFLTDDGRTLARAVGNGLDLMRQAVGELRASARQGRRWVLSCEPTLLMRWLILRWPDFQARHPGIDVHLVAGGGSFSFASGIDLAIRRDDFPWPEGYHAEPLFAEKVGPVCRPDKVATWFSTKKAGAVLKAGAPRLHTRTRPGAWSEWATAAGQPVSDAPGQTFEHFYFSLQAAVAGLGVAIGPWHLVRDDLDSGVLAAPLGFIEDGSRYCLLSPQPLPPDGPQADLLAWLRAMA